MSLKQPATQIDIQIYHGVLENWGHWARLDGVNRLLYGSKATFNMDPSAPGLTPDELEALLAEQVLVHMYEFNRFYVEWLKRKYYAGLTDRQMARLYKCGFNKNRVNKQTSLTVFGNFFESLKKNGAGALYVPPRSG